MTTEHIKLLIDNKAYKQIQRIKRNATPEVVRYYDFLEKYITEEKGDANISKSHTCFGEPWGNYKIPDEKNKEFLQLYTAVLEKTALHVVERPKEIGPLVIDLDFKFVSKYNERQYKLSDIELVVEKFNDKLTKYFKIESRNLLAFVTEKKEPSQDTKNNQYKDGFHIVYPYAPIRKEFRHFLIEEVRDEVEKEKSFEHLPYCNSLSDVFDLAVVIRNGWLLYGSKKPEGQVYQLTHVFDQVLNDVYLPDDDIFSRQKLPQILSIRKYTEEDCLEFRKDQETPEFKSKILTILEKNSKKKKKESQLISIETGDEEETGLVDDCCPEPTNKTSPSSNQSSHDRSKSFGELKGKKKVDPLKRARELLNLLSPSRAENYHDWIHVGWALHNVSPKLLPDWIAFSKKSPTKYEEGGCEREWAKANDSGLTLASLHWWARNDNPEVYLEMIRGDINELLLEAESGTHTDIANVVCEFYKHYFRCSDITNSVWYEFQDHRWVKIDSAYTLSSKISDDLTKEFALVASIHCKNGMVFKGQDRDMTFKRSELLHKLINKLKTSSFKKNVIEECAIKLYDKDFEEKLDSNKDLVGFNNGVYDLKAGSFRNGTPDDYITLSTGYDYIEYKETDQKVKDVMDYFKKVHVEADLREYFLTLVCSYLDGHIKQQKFIIWTGSGSNSKSITVNFIQLAFGDYFDTLPPTILTRKRGNSSNATPELANKRGKRCVFLQEPEGDDAIYVGGMKEYTGGDFIMVRPLYKSPFKYKPQFKLVLVCNKLPFIPSRDGGTWRRIRVTPFESEFIDGIPKHNKQFPKDYDINEKLIELKEAFMWVLLKKYYHNYYKNGYKIVEPKKVTQYTDKYKKDSDVYYEYISETIRATKNNDDSLSIMMLYKMFKEWFRDNHAGGKCPDKKDLVNYLLNGDYKIANGSILGFKLSRDMEDDDIEKKKKPDIIASLEK